VQGRHCLAEPVPLVGRGWGLHLAMQPGGTEYLMMQ
jgi:hypothetical protein